MVQCPEDMAQYTIFQEDKDMRNWKKVLLAVVPAAMMFSFTAFAGQWHQDMNGWWYENEDGSYCKNGWFWLDGNEDGEAECYCFDNDGYALVSLYNLTSKAAGYDVNMDGAWGEKVEVQVQHVM